MPKTISDEQRDKLWTIADRMELVIGQVEGFSVILNRIAECAEGQADGTAIFTVSNALSECVEQLSKSQSKLFHGLREHGGDVTKAGAS